MAETLKEFLVRIGYKVDGGTEGRFINSVGKVTALVFKLGAGVTAAAALVEAGVARMARGMEELHYAARRISASANDIEAFASAVSQMGGTADGARSSLEGLARAMRNPGMRGLVASLAGAGVDLEDRVAVMTALGNRLRQMPRYLADLYGQQLGIDDRTLQALIDGTHRFSAEYHRMARSLGVDLNAAGQSSQRFMREWRGMGALVELIGRKISSALSDDLSLGLRRLRDMLEVHGPRIAWFIEKLARGAIWLSEVMVQLAVTLASTISDLVDWFNRLDPAAQRGVTALGALGAAWLLLNSRFLNSPIGRIIALGTALLMLLDDYRAWREGSEHVIDWERWEPHLVQAREAVEWLARKFDELARATIGWENALLALASVIAARVLLPMGTLFKIMRGLATMTLPGWLLTMLLANPSAANAQERADQERLRNGEALPGNDRQRPDGSWEPARPSPPGWFQRNVVPFLQRNGWQFRDDRGGQGQPPGGGNAGRQQLGQQAMEFFQRAGWTAEQAAGLVGNIQHESNFDHGIRGDGGRAFGLAQWHPDRQENLSRFIGRPANSATFQEQLAFIHHELTQGAEQRAGAALRGARTAGEAGSVVSRLYERPRNTWAEAAARARTAEQWMAATPPGTNPALAGRQGGVTQNNNITVTGAQNAQATAAAVGDELRRTNIDLVRNMRSAVA